MALPEEVPAEKVQRVNEALSKMSAAEKGALASGRGAKWRTVTEVLSTTTRGPNGYESPTRRPSPNPL